MAAKEKKGAKGAKGAAGKGAKGAAQKGKQPAQQQSAKSKKGGAEAARKAVVQREHHGVDLPVPAPRLKEYYNSSVRAKLTEQFGYSNPHMVPTVHKIVLNVGLGEAVKQPKLLDAVVDELGVITGQRPVRKKARKSIANFGLREGQEIGVAVTLRGNRMWEFMDRFISTAVPRIRDFRGLSTRSFDGRGNYSMGVKEQMIFPEIEYDTIDQIRGMDITFVTTTNRDNEALALLRELGMPFRGEEKPVVVQPGSPAA